MKSLAEVIKEGNEIRAGGIPVNESFLLRLPHLKLQSGCVKFLVPGSWFLVEGNPGRPCLACLPGSLPGESRS